MRGIFIRNSNFFQEKLLHKKMKYHIYQLMRVVLLLGFKYRLSEPLRSLILHNIHINVILGNIVDNILCHI